MKKILIIVLIIALAIGVITYVTIQNNNKAQSNSNIQINFEGSNIMENVQNDEVITNEISNTEVTNNDETRIKLSFNNEEVYVKLDDNESSKQFLEMLPLTLEFEDYNNTEKIATLPEKLNTDTAPSGYDPQIGDFSYYAPWGNLSIFYKDFRYSNSLVKLGTFESGIEKLAGLNQDFTMTIERIN